MDLKSLRTLELAKVLDRLAQHASFSASKELARDLQPSGHMQAARVRQQETTEARHLLSTKSDTTIGGARDVRPQVLGASRGAVLEPSDFLDLKNTLLSARTLSRLFERSSGQFPRLAEIAAGLHPLPEIVEAITRTLSDRGEVLDGASPKLASLRRDLKLARERLMTKLERILGDAKVAPLLQDAIVTQRDGRFVIPLRAEFKGRLKAIVHDQSASGATLFVEPVAVIEMNNALRELELAERDEVRRILAELSGRIGSLQAEIASTVEALAGLDLAFAKGRYAETLRATEPVLASATGSGPAAHLSLRKARHPLLDPASVVPIDLVLDEATRALILTGPNTGGKTVSLKTAGLLALMAACGLHLPAGSGSEVPLYDAVFADIGDEQSIEQSLSTFSSHISNIIRILGEATPRSLVLLDELGAGTDPQEGAALARAILDTLLERGCATLVATHYPDLKAYAHATPGVQNASVEFDLETLRPTYRLTIGLPGRSNALAIAERLGLDAEIIERARGLVSPDDLRAEGLLEEIHKQRSAADLERAQAEEDRREAETLRSDLDRRLESIEDERRRILEAARAQASRDLESLSDEVRELRRKLAAAGQPLVALREAEEQVEALAEARLEPVVRQVRRESAAEDLRLGDRVRLPRLGAEGVVTEVGREEVEVQIGRLRIRARAEEMERSSRPAPAVAEGRNLAGAGGVVPPLEIDLRGLLVDEALEELERRLDAAFRTGLPYLRVIHGKGTGRLRQAVRQALKSSPYVVSAEPGREAEGGDGVTMVKLEESSP